jgi:hypothetical protein
MARHSTHILELAKRGAEVRLRELKAEIAALMKVFPHLRYGAAVSPAMPDAVEERATRRRRMSPAERKAVSDRMKKIWAARRRKATR